MIEAIGISKSYGTLRVLDDVSISLADSEITAIVGPSGAGKTTLLQIIGTLDRPDGGDVQYDGTSVFGMSERKLSSFRNRHVGFVFQFHQLLPEFSLIENIIMPALISGVSVREATRRAETLCDYLGISNRLSHRPAQLSGGECQRGAVARALMNNPSIILADEPTGSLDSHNRAELHRLFFDIRRDMGASFAIVTHDESLAADCDKIVHLRDGVVERIDTNV
jgi:lipoprotein ABC transporter, ATP-binding protein